MISNDNITWMSHNMNTAGYTKRNTESRIVSYLPLNHIAANVNDIHSMMEIGVDQPPSLYHLIITNLTHHTLFVVHYFVCPPSPFLPRRYDLFCSTRCFERQFGANIERSSTDLLLWSSESVRKNDGENDKN